MSVRAAMSLVAVFLGVLASSHGGAAGHAPHPSASTARESPAQPDGRRTIEVLARRFAFEPPVIEVTVGEPVRLIVRSGDGVHGFGIERLRIRRDIPRGGDAITIDFAADRPGSYPIVCTEYCGSGHERMTGTLLVRATDDVPGTVPAPDNPEER